MLSQTFTVPHNSDGTKSVSYTYKFGPTITQNLGSGGSVTAGGSLWTIPRAPSKPAAPTLTYIPPTTIKANGVAPAANGSPIEWYHFLVDTNNPPIDGSPNFRTVSGGSNPSATVTGLSLDTTYYINFAARNAQGWGPRSSASMLSIGGVPGKPTVTNVELSPPNRLVIAYSAPASQGGSTITHYSLSYYKAGQSATPVYVSNIGKTGSYTLTVDPGYDYYVQVAAVNSQGTGEYSSAFGPTNVYAGPKVRYTIGGTSEYRDAESYVRHDGVWKPAMGYVRHAGVWKPLTT